MPARARRRAPKRPRRVAERPVRAYAPPSLLLLDAHAFVWFVVGDERLSARVRRAIENPDATRYVSAASVWEIAIKWHQGKLAEAQGFLPGLSAYLRDRGFTELPITVDHAEVAGALPLLHRDPFDRMLVAQARVEGLALVSNEALFDRYGVRRLW